MKKLILLLCIFTIGTIAFTSCQKKYKCVCKMAGIKVDEVDFSGDSPKDAENKCKEMDADYSLTFGSCKLK